MVFWCFSQKIISYLGFDIPQSERNMYYAFIVVPKTFDNQGNHVFYFCFDFFKIYHYGLNQKSTIYDYIFFKNQGNEGLRPADIYKQVLSFCNETYLICR